MKLYGKWKYENSATTVFGQEANAPFAPTGPQLYITIFSRTIDMVRENMCYALQQRLNICARFLEKCRKNVYE